MNPKLIKTAVDHREATNRLEGLMLSDPPADSEESEEIELLAFLIEKYEQEQIEIDAPSPVEAIRFRMEQQGLKQGDLVPFIGNKSKVSEILSGKRPLTLPMIRNLHRGLEIPSDVLLQEPGEQIPERIDPSAYPVREMHKRGWIPQYSEREWPTVKNHDEEMLHAFFRGRHLEPIGALNRQKARAKSKINDEALHAWRCRALDLAGEKNLGSFKSEDLTEHFIRQLTYLSERPEGPVLAVQSLEERGIAVVLEPQLEGTFLDGAAMLLPSGTPVIGLTLRYDRLDNFWFTLFHELGHVKLHLGKVEKRGFWDSEIDKYSENLIELEADRFALNEFIPEEEWDELRHLRLADQISQAARRLSIHPAIIAGRLRREAQDYRRHRTLIGQGKVKELFRYHGLFELRK
ncbi:MAG: ImmA/IrrE family metallo-endopeptidase [Verrucomicrobiota bacterium]